MNFSKYIKRLTGLALTVSLAFACTHDYFVDETNFRLHVPQIAELSDDQIENLYIAFHDAGTGRHVLTRKLTAPFTQDEFMRDEGILRFKIIPGDYDITLFADYTPGAITEGNVYGDSYKFKTKSSYVPFSMRSTPYEVYSSRITNPRQMKVSATAHPMDHPDSHGVVEADLTADHRFKGKINIEFRGLPDVIERVDVVYKGLGTRYDFDGLFCQLGVDDRILKTYTSADMIPTRAGGLSLPVDIINASSGTKFNGTAVSPTPVELEVYLYTADGSLSGVASFTQDDFDALAASEKPKDGNGDPLTELVLHSQETINFVFNGFVLFSIDLQGWGDTEQGEIGGPGW